MPLGSLISSTVAVSAAGGSELPPQAKSASTATRRVMALRPTANTRLPKAGRRQPPRLGHRVRSQRPAPAGDDPLPCAARTLVPSRAQPFRQAPSRATGRGGSVWRIPNP